jgi:hypothetical protein
MFTFELARSNDLFRYGELTKARNRSLTLALNRAGAFSFRMPLENNSLADSLQELTTCVVIRYNNEIVWSGPVWTIEETTPNSINVGCVGWFQTLEKRIINPEWCVPTLSYIDVDAGAIVADLIDRTNSEPYGQVNYLTMGSIETTQQRTRNYSPYGTIANEIQQLSTIESGFDFDVDPETRELSIFSILQEDKVHVNFEYGTNIVSASRRSDSARLVNRIFVSGGAGTTTQVSYDSASITTYGLHEEYISLSDVTNNTILAAFGQAELAVRANPLRLISFDPRKFLLSPRDPMIFQDFSIGDIVYATINKGRFNVSKQAVRVFGATVNWDDNGSVQLTAVQTQAQ